MQEQGTDPEEGLSPAEAEARLRTYGPNAIAAGARAPWWVVFGHQLKEPLAIILGAAVVVTGFLHEWLDFSAISFAVLLNAAIGTVQELRAERAMAALKDLTPALATATRSGHPTRIPARELVPGDMVVLQAGDKVPADMRVVRGYSLRTDEAALTGESMPVEKDARRLPEATLLADRANMVYAGTSVSYGRGVCLAVATGMATEVGRIAELLCDQAERQSPLQRELVRVGRVLTIVVGLLVVAFFVLGLLRGAAFADIFLTSVSLAVAAIPEGLPTVVTVVLALGVQRMAAHKALIRKLAAVEALGSATFICTDKTGTLTQNRMKVADTWVDGDDTTQLLLGGFLCNDATLSIAGSPKTGQVRPRDATQTDATEVALTEAAMDAGVDSATLSRYPRVAELPFDSERKMMTTIHEDSRGGFLSITKGAPDVVVQRCSSSRQGGLAVPMTDDIRAAIDSKIGELSSRGLRVLAVAERATKAMPEEGEHDLVFIGLAGLSDPPRPEVIAAIRMCKCAGITPVMITGDHVVTAQAIAAAIGMMSGDEVALDGREVGGMSDEELEHAMGTARVFARVAPEQKLRIVAALQSRGEIVAMTGDGVNDGPALKRADIGIAMGITGSDVAKEAADMTLADDNFATIVRAVEEGRTVYNNIQRAVHFLLSCNFGEIAAVLGAALAGLAGPLTAVQILWINLVTDTVPALGLGVEPPEEGVMNRPPRLPDEGILSARKLSLTLLHGAFIGLLTLAAYIWVRRDTGNSQAAGTAAFATLGLVQFVQACNMRSLDRSLLSLPPFSNPTLTWGITLSVALHLAAVLLPVFRPVFNTVPLPGSSWVAIGVASLAMVPVSEAIKGLRRMPWKRRTT